MSEYSEIQFWAFIFFLSFVVWPILYLIIDRHHVATWMPYVPPQKNMRNTGKGLTQTQPRTQQ